MDSQTLSRDQILAAADRVPVRVEVPEWGGHVFVKVMTGTERDDFERWAGGKIGKDGNLDPRGLRANLLRRVLVSADGKPIFTGEDIEAISGKSCKVLDDLATMAQHVNGLTKKDIKELAKNSAIAPDSASG